MTKFFAKDAPGLKADIERHREKEQQLEARIAAMEAIPVEERGKFHDRYLANCKHFLFLLNNSKAEAVSKIGRK